MIIEDEVQHSAYQNSVVEKFDPMIMQSSRGQNFNRGNQNYHQGNQFFRGRKPFMQCEYCHLTGHTKDNCYKLIGYPNDWKQRKKGEYSEGNGGNYKGGKSLASVNHGGYGVQVGSSSQRLFTSANNVSGKHEDPGKIASTSHPSGSHEVNNTYVAKGHGFTEEEYKQILGLLNKDQDPEASYSMTGNATCLTRNCFSEEWIVDFGASHHIASRNTCWQQLIDVPQRRTR